MSRIKGEIGLLLTAIIWGSGFVASAISLDSYSPYQIMAGRFTIGAIVLSVIFAKKFQRLTKATIFKGMILGFILFIAFAFQTVGLQYTTPSKNAFLTAVNVVIVPFLGFCIYKKRVDLFETAGAVLAIIGVGLLSLQFSGVINIGDFLSLLCALGFAFHIVFTAKYVQKADPFLLTIIQMITAAFIGWVVLVFRGETNMVIETKVLWPIVYLGIFSTSIAFLLQTVAQKYTSETKAAIILSTESFWGMTFSVLLLNELLTTRMIVGAALILIAVILSETKLNFLKNKRVEETIQ
ncbi:DMT family transporter [Bacillus kwashiorkori]|uniref:DMT family transporter n=1 Tax=Bacillus kwashiorkori TaxID=1522318 RepID=UPI0007858252|nr:DMT family transporter [Bacillus kwashiorkori]